MAHEIAVLYRAYFDSGSFITEHGVLSKSELEPPARAELNERENSPDFVGHVALYLRTAPFENQQIVGWRPNSLNRGGLSPAATETELMLWLARADLSAHDYQEARWVNGQWLGDEAWAIKGIGDKYTPTRVLRAHINERQMQALHEALREMNQNARYQMSANLGPLHVLRRWFPEGYFNCLTAVRHVLRPLSPSIASLISEHGKLGFFDLSAKEASTLWIPTCEELAELQARIP